MVDIITLQDAKALGLKRYFTGLPCKNGHVVERKVLDRTCIECNRLKSQKFSDVTKQWRIDNLERDKESKKQHYLENKSSYIEKAREWENNNPDRSRELKNKWRKSNKGILQSQNWVKNNTEKHAKSVHDWKINNPDKTYEYASTRRAALLNSMPLWLTPVDREKIREIYTRCKAMEAQTGIKHNVDHIIPLQGENVCGLHVPWNLQIITETENFKKSNKVIINNNEDKFRNFIISLNLSFEEMEKSSFVMKESNVVLMYKYLYDIGEMSNNILKDNNVNIKNDFLEMGYNAIFIFNDEYENKTLIVENRINYILGLSPHGIGGRKSVIKKIIWKEAKVFLNTYHIQGAGSAGFVSYGAYDNDDLIAVMTFCLPRVALGRKTGYPELLRFATDNYSHPGLASKMFKTFIKDYHPDGVISYADYRWSLGNLYKTLGFTCTGLSDPNYYYTKDYHSRYFRFGFRKSILVDKYGGDPMLSEKTNMQRLGYDRIWDCGSLKFIWTSDGKH